MKNSLSCAILAAGLAVFVSPARALPEVAIGAIAGTLGAGGQITVGLLPLLNGRVSVQGLGLSPSFDRDGVDYDGKLKLLTYGGYLDLYPFSKGLRLSAGVVGNQNRLGLRATCADTCEVGDVTVSDSNGVITGRLGFRSIAPYAGIGFSNPITGSPFYFGVDLGVLFQDRPKPQLSASGTATVSSNDGLSRQNVDLATDPDFQTALAQERDELADTTRKYRFYPVLQLNIGWRF